MTILGVVLTVLIGVLIATQFVLCVKLTNENLQNMFYSISVYFYDAVHILVAVSFLYFFCTLKTFVKSYLPKYFISTDAVVKTKRLLILLAIILVLRAILIQGLAL